MTDLLVLQRRYNLSPLLAKLLLLLAHNPIVTAEMISADNDAAPIANRVSMVRLRKRLIPLGIYVQSQRHLGYWINEDIRVEVLASTPEQKLSA